MNAVKLRGTFLALMLGSWLAPAYGELRIEYNFESIDLASGPDSFQLFEQAKSDVSISSLYAHQGSYSLHLSDHQGNLSFPEFQGYFPEQDDRKIDIHFAFMTPDPNQLFNMAVAGRGHYRLAMNGHFFWLFNDGANLRHMSDGMPKKLFKLAAFQWYIVDVSMDLEDSTYSLMIRNEAGEELVNLEQQVSASNQPGSSINQYSFITGLSDKNASDYFIDDFVLTAFSSKSADEFVAPGRRALFIEKWQSYYRKIEQPTHCLPSLVVEDFIQANSEHDLATFQDNAELLRKLLSRPSLKKLNSIRVDEPLLKGMIHWAKGCDLLRQQKFKSANRQFDLAQGSLGEVPGVQFALAIAAAQIGDGSAADSIIRFGKHLWPDDIRWRLLESMIGFLLYKDDTGEFALEHIAHELDIYNQQTLKLMSDLGWLGRPAAERLKQDYVWDDNIRHFIVAEQYYFSLLWQEKHSLATEYADYFIQLLDQHSVYSPLWVERQGDAALLNRDLDTAESVYSDLLENELVKAEFSQVATIQKLADVYFLKGMVEKEREMRSKIYGALKYE